MTALMVELNRKTYCYESDPGLNRALSATAKVLNTVGETVKSGTLDAVYFIRNKATRLLLAACLVGIVALEAGCMDKAVLKIAADSNATAVAVATARQDFRNATVPPPTPAATPTPKSVCVNTSIDVGDGDRDTVSEAVYDLWSGGQHSGDGRVSYPNTTCIAVFIGGSWVTLTSDDGGSAINKMFGDGRLEDVPDNAAIVVGFNGCACPTGPAHDVSQGQ